MTTIFRSDSEDTITEEEDETLELTREEVQSILDECKYSYVAYSNQIARNTIRKMSDFLHYTEIIEKK